MHSPIRDIREKQPEALHDRAMDNLRYIRQAMERSGSFTHVSGIGGVGMGSLAIGAAALAWNASTTAEWLAIWLVAAGASLAVSVLAMARKSAADGVTLLTGPGRKFAWSVTPPLAAGGVLTIALVRAGAFDLLPGMWLLLYGAAIVTGGSHSVRSIPFMGAAFMAAGVGALLTPASWGDVWMAVGFGVLHIVFGALIWRKHGG
ncbi:MAG: hypothetical protein AAF389_18165 [Gemmatimonadota bacterium]